MGAPDPSAIIGALVALCEKLVPRIEVLDAAVTQLTARVAQLEQSAAAVRVRITRLGQSSAINGYNSRQS